MSRRYNRRQPSTEQIALGQRILAARERANMDLCALAQRMDVTWTAAYNWERGLARPMNTRMAKLAAVLGLTLAELHGDHPIQQQDEEQADRRLQDEGAGHAATMHARADAFERAGDFDRAADCRALADLYAAHWPRGYPACDIPPGEGAPKRLSGDVRGSVFGSSAAACADMGGGKR